MPRNVEVKARIEGTLNELMERIQPLADGPPIQLKQIDTFFNCSNRGRLKLRVEQNRSAHLIYYERNENPLESNPKVSNYSIVEISHPDELIMIQSRSTCFQWGFYDPQMSGSIDGTDLIPHDRAIIRAYKTKYQKPKINSSLFIGHIPRDCDENHLKILFPKAQDIHLIRDRVTKESKGYAFANGFIDRTKEYRWNQHLLFIENVASNTLIGWKPRRCGGGLGGNKTSGQLRFGGTLRPFQQNSFRQFNKDVQQRWKYLLDKTKILQNKSKQKRIELDEK